MEAQLNDQQCTLRYLIFLNLPDPGFALPPAPTQEANALFFFRENRELLLRRSF